MGNSRLRGSGSLGKPPEPRVVESTLRLIGVALKLVQCFGWCSLAHQRHPLAGTIVIQSRFNWNYCLSYCATMKDTAAHDGVGDQCCPISNRPSNKSCQYHNRN